MKNTLVLLAASVCLAWAQSPETLLKGRIEDSQGRPVAAAAVQVTDSGGRVVGSALTDAGGGFEVETLSGERYDVRVQASGFQALRRDSVASEADLHLTLAPEALRESVTVTATRSETPVTALPSAATLLDKETIDQQRAISDNLASVLERTAPGFGPSLQKLAGRAETLRGRNPLYLINGVPQHNSLRDGQRDGYTIDMDFVEQVEVIHGSNAMQGVGATGGVVNMTTKAPPADGRWRQDIRLALSSHDSFDGDGLAPKASYFLGKKVGKFDVAGGFSAMKRDLFFDAEGQPVGLYPTQGDIMDSGSRNLYFRGGFTPSSTQRLGLTVNDFKLRRDGDYVVALGDRGAGRVTSTAPGDPRPLVGDPAQNDVTTLSADYRNRDALGGDFSAQIFYQDFAARYEGGEFGGFYRLTPDGEPFLDQSQIESRKLGFKLLYSVPENGAEGFTPRFGLDFFDDDSAQTLTRSGREWVPSTTLRSWAPFVQLEQKFADRLTLSGGVRVEAAQVIVGDYTTIASAGAVDVSGGRPSFNEVLPNAGALFRLGAGFSLFGSYSEGFTMPDVGRVLRAINRPGVDVDSLLDVEPVVTNNTEGGLRYRNGRARFEASYYQSDSNLGALLIADENGFFNVGRQRTEIDGVEISTDVRLSDRFILGGNYAWLRGRFDFDGDDIVDSDLDGSNIAPNRVNAFLQFFPASWMNGRLQFSGFFDREFETNGGAGPPDFAGYGLVDLILGFETRAGRVRFGAENLLDRQYLTYFSQTEPFQRNDTIFAGRGRTFTFIFEPRLAKWW